MTYKQATCDICGGPLLTKNGTPEIQGIVTSHGRYWCGCQDTKGIDLYSWAFEYDYFQTKILIDPETNTASEYTILVDGIDLRDN